MNVRMKLVSREREGGKGGKITLIKKEEVPGRASKGTRKPFETHASGLAGGIYVSSTKKKEGIKKRSCTVQRE